MAARLTTYLVVSIVAATLIAGLIVGAQRDDDDGPVDLIVHNAVVFSGDASGTTAEAIAVRGNQVLKVGGNREILRLRRPQTIVIDAKGGSVLPGFNDAHVHLVEGGLSLEQVDLTDAATVAEAVERVRLWADAHPQQRWIVGRGWTAFADPEDKLTRQALDEVAPDRPVYLASEDGTAAWVNSRALKLAKIARRTQDPVEGHIEKDAKGEPSGLLEGKAAALVGALLPKPTRDERVRAIFAAIAEARRSGITSLQTAGLEEDEIQLLDTARRDGELQARIYAALAVRPPKTEVEVEKLDPQRHPDDPMLKSGVADVDAGLTGVDGLNRLVRLLDARGWQVAIHESTTDDVTRAENALSHAMRSNTTRELERRHRTENHTDHFDQVGTRHVVGSDWPYGPLSPMRVLASLPESMALKDAIVGYTSAGAYASLDEQRKGTLKKGMLADIVVLSKDILKLPRTELPTVSVTYTIFDGRLVYPVSKETTFP